MARPRKNGERYQNGKLKPDNSLPGAKVRRIVEMAEKGAADPLLGTPIGWLLMTGELAETKNMAHIMAEAARLYGDQRRQWDFANGVPPRSAKALDMNRVAAGSTEIGADAGKLGSRYERTRDGVFALLPLPMARAALDVLDDVIVCLSHPAYADIQILKAGLYAVAEANGMLPARSRLKPVNGGRCIKSQIG